MTVPPFAMINVSVQSADELAELAELLKRQQDKRKAPGETVEAAEARPRPMTGTERNYKWRAGHLDRNRAYQREYMRKRRAAKRLEAAAEVDKAAAARREYERAYKARKRAEAKAAR